MLILNIRKMPFLASIIYLFMVNLNSSKTLAKVRERCLHYSPLRMFVCSISDKFLLNLYNMRCPQILHDKDTNSS